MRIDHVGVVVRDTDVSREFYRAVLGAEVVDTHKDDRVWLTFLSVGGQIIELVQHLDRDYIPRERGPVDHIAFRDDDLEQALVRAKAGDAVLVMPEPIVVGSKKIIFLTGPDGERLEFVQYM